MPLVTSKEQVKYTFTRDELVNIARDQARHHAELSELEDQMENFKTDHKAKVSVCEAQISRCTVRVSTGYEMRSVECIILKFRPDGEHALTIRTDNGRVVRNRKLEMEERQTTLTVGEPEGWAFEADFYQDTESDVAECVATGVPLTADEAKKLKDVVEMKPLRKAIEGPAA